MASSASWTSSSNWAQYLEEAAERDSHLRIALTFFIILVITYTLSNCLPGGKDVADLVDDQLDSGL